jgi:aminoglycoside phosphotransferase family enzyme/predicted kinase
MNQDEIIRRLSMGEGFNNVPPERINTHISTIFLIGDDAYKMKHAVATSYLNYASLENRHRFCQAELDINRRTAPQLYLDIVPVRVTSEDEIVLGDGPGDPVEWLVHMRRFSQDALLDSLADENRLTNPMTIDLADQIAAFHSSQVAVSDKDAASRIAFVIDENEQELLNYAGGCLDRPKVGAFNDLCRAQLTRHQSRINHRGDAGFVRHCHGDLHLRNICLLDGQPTLFDAIEFNDAISHIDILFDLAFLVMDLEHRDRRLQANLLFNRYLYRTRDIEDLALLPLYVAVRAGIRAHTTAMAAEMANDDSYKGQLERDAVRYLDQGLRTLRPQPPSLITVGGLSGSGKSTIATNIAPFTGPVPGALILSSDLIRKRQLGVEPLTQLDETAYDKETDEQVYSEILNTATRVLSQGHSVVLDATFQDPVRRQEAETVGHMPGIQFGGIWLDAAATQLHERIDSRSNDPSDATTTVLAKQLANDTGDISWTKIDADRPLEAVIESVKDALSADAIMQ